MAAFHRGSRVADWEPLCELTSRLLAAALPPEAALEAAPDVALGAEQRATAAVLAAAAAAAEQMDAVSALPSSHPQESEAVAAHQQAAGASAAIATPASQSSRQPAAHDADVAEAVAAPKIAAAPAAGELAAQALRLLQAVLIGHCQVMCPAGHP